ncbi:MULTISPECIES: PLP-dependent aminotransferase family protein [unclassified Sinorhizobium]|uniref:aminotransferase-like domain-containing protein n=1 Tax=unclassified Sinorhizobium TaxID=2613772 RepID=UPI0024C27791|nr:MULTISPECIES: PLP-dependent aminotransferase family protein [unclassified Sinorhizobium]MDK1378156.1 PLP-dependent aminotransferase family protein [Sinorhizobium sp. 6-70]MDK1479795.1 PLP-dependent aminotransferase family protein [Sinorhizobium sp. 6-117]
MNNNTDNDLKREISLVRSTPPAVADIEGAFKKALTQIADDSFCARLIQQHRFGGTLRDKEAASQWLERRFGERIDPDRVIVTASAQNAMSILLSFLARPGDAVMVEDLSYHGLRMIASSRGNILLPVRMDEEGALPAAVLQAIRQRRPKAAFFMPTLHNPTTAIMSEERRSAIAEIARQNGVVLIEDDVYGGLVRNAPRPIAASAGDVTWHITSFAKTVGPGVRLAYIVAPTAPAADILVKSLQGVSYWFPAPLAAEIAQRWIFEGTMAALCESVRQEALIRQEIAGDCLAQLRMKTKPECLFSWLELPDGIKQAHLVNEARKQGIILRPGKIFEEAPGASKGHIRLVFGSPDTRQDLRYALEMLVKIIRETAS